MNKERLSRLANVRMVVEVGVYGVDKAAAMLPIVLGKRTDNFPREMLYSRYVLDLAEELIYAQAVELDKMLEVEALSKLHRLNRLAMDGRPLQQGVSRSTKTAHNAGSAEFALHMFANSPIEFVRTTNVLAVPQGLEYDDMVISIAVQERRPVVAGE